MSINDPCAPLQQPSLTHTNKQINQTKCRTWCWCAESDVELRRLQKGLKTSRGWRERKRGHGEKSAGRSFNPGGAVLSWASRPQYCSWDWDQHREDESRFWSVAGSHRSRPDVLRGCGLKWNLLIHSKGTVHPKSNSEWGGVLSLRLDQAWLT